MITHERYEHTQHGWIHWILVVMSVGLISGASFGAIESPIDTILLVMGLIFLAFAGCFATLTIRDEGDQLIAQFGPLPLIKKRIQIADITQVDVGRSSFLDGWGIHYVPTRGWIYNIAGFDCVSIQMKGSTFRLGTDDPKDLTAYLQARINTSAN